MKNTALNGQSWSRNVQNYTEYGISPWPSLDLLKLAHAHLVKSLATRLKIVLWASDLLTSLNRLVNMSERNFSGPSNRYQLTFAICLSYTRTSRSSLSWSSNFYVTRRYQLTHSCQVTLEISRSLIGWFLYFKWNEWCFSKKSYEFGTPNQYHVACRCPDT